MAMPKKGNFNKKNNLINFLERFLYETHYFTRSDSNLVNIDNHCCHYPEKSKWVITDEESQIYLYSFTLHNTILLPQPMQSFMNQKWFRQVIVMDSLDPLT